MHLLLFLVFITVNISAQTQLGYTPNKNFEDSPLLGTWLNKSLYIHGKEPARNLWQRIDIKSNGEMIHDYYYMDPASSQSIPFERLFSRWSAGTYVDPDSTLGEYLVLEINPYESQSLKDDTREYRILRNNFLPVYRRFSITASKSFLKLSEPFILIVPFVGQLRSFPSDTIFLNYSKSDHHTSAVRRISWGQIKSKH